MILTLHDQLSETEKTPKGQHKLAWEMLSAVLQKYTGEEPCVPSSFFYGPHGRPFWKDHPQVDFSISHCKEAVAAAVCLSGSRVGLDVERRFAWKESLARRISHPDELKLLLAMEDKQMRESAFNLLWSLKESYLKYTGEGLLADPRGLNFLKTHQTEHHSDYHIGERLEPTGLFAPGMEGGKNCIFHACQNARYTLVVCASPDEEIVVCG